MKRIILLVLVFFLALSCFHAKAEDKYPSKPITVIVPWPAGGGTDVVHRAAAKYAEKYLGQPMLIVNKPGAGGVIGAKIVENARPDGYTLGGITSTVLATQYTVTNPTNWDNNEPVFTLTLDPAAIAVRNESEWRTLKEFVAFAKAHPKELTVGNAGIGALHHLFAVALEDAAGVKFHNISYKGAAPAKTAVLGGHIDAISADTSALYAQVVSGQLRLLGVAADERHRGFPNMPTYKEQGIDLSIAMYRILTAPKGTPREIIETLENAYIKTMRNPEFMKLEGRWLMIGKGAEETARLMEKEDNMWKRLAAKYKEEY